MEELINKIKAHNSYQEESIKNTENIVQLAKEILDTNSTIREAIELWLDSNQETEMVVDGINYYDLVNKCHMTPIAAYLTLDWIVKKPKVALKELKKEYHELR